MSDESAGGTRPLESGTRVEVRDGFEGQWHRGYLVEGVTDEGHYLVRRASDDSVLPKALPPASLRRERRNSMWWI